MRPDEVMMPQLALSIQATNLDCGGKVLRDAAFADDSNSNPKAASRSTLPPQSKRAAAVPNKGLG
jgi:hypothetical protein